MTPKRTARADQLADELYAVAKQDSKKFSDRERLSAFESLVCMLQTRINSLRAE